jgi:hypothetical protein
MSSLIQRQKPVIDRSGLGLLPGIGLAFAFALLVMAALLFEAWWVTIAVLLTLFAITRRRGRGRRGRHGG